MRLSVLLRRVAPTKVVLVLLMVTAFSTTSADEKQSAALLKTFVEEFVPITPGEGKFPASFQVGSKEGDTSEQPPHEVTFQYKFAIAKYEMPQNLYEAVMGTNPSRWKGPRNSVEMMNWKDANDFCRKITRQLRDRQLIGADEVIRLPTEAEWEYCCRAGTSTRYSFGDDAQKPGDVTPKATFLGEYGWHTGNAAGNDPPVGALKPNPWGLYDMHGYLWELTADEWRSDYKQAPKDGAVAKGADVDGTSIVLRGGSWKDRFDKLTSSSRRKFSSNAADDAVGFRCVKATAQ